MNFLERESTPKQLLALPAEEMAEKQQQKKAVAFNPFNAPRHATLPVSTTQTGITGRPLGGVGEQTTDSSHPLMAPASPTMSFYQPVFSKASGVSQPPVTSTSALLEDMLQQ